MRSAVAWATACVLLVAPACGDDESGGSLFEGGEDAGDASGGTSGFTGFDGSGEASSGGGQGGAGGDGCGDFGLDEPCKACLAAKCCEKAGDCASSAACRDLVACVRDCPVDAGGGCTQACVGDHADGITQYNPLVLCMGTDCVSACPYATP